MRAILLDMPDEWTPGAASEYDVLRYSREQEPIVLTQLLKTMSRIAPADDETVNGCLKAHCAHADERVKSAAERLLSSRQ